MENMALVSQNAQLLAVSAQQLGWLGNEIDKLCAFLHTQHRK